MIVRTDEEIQETIGMVNARLQEKLINRHVNAAIKEGYKEALHILCEKITTIDDIPTRVKSTQGRFIAWLAVDYLIGQCDQKTLVNVPIKKQP
ncbi:MULTISPECIES: hypothetical protein [unclassified Dysgonomonas]|uniref:hypothetical protein n=1 Tax=unclassified Dysgonomonas TaxID=2630389 RepID=UPI00247474F7|nr:MULTISPECIES: hypothetical protein [unclassified Dysgonomonas]